MPRKVVVRSDKSKSAIDPIRVHWGNEFSHSSISSTFIKPYQLIGKVGEVYYKLRCVKYMYSVAFPSGSRIINSSIDDLFAETTTPKGKLIRVNLRTLIPGGFSLVGRGHKLCSAVVSSSSSIVVELHRRHKAAFFQKKRDTSQKNVSPSQVPSPLEVPERKEPVSPVVTKVDACTGTELNTVGEAQIPIYFNLTPHSAYVTSPSPKVDYNPNKLTIHADNYREDLGYPGGHSLCVFQWFISSVIELTLEKWSSPPGGGDPAKMPWWKPKPLTEFVALPGIKQLLELLDRSPLEGDVKFLYEARLVLNNVIGPGTYFIDSESPCADETVRRLRHMAKRDAALQRISTLKLLAQPP